MLDEAGKVDFEKVRQTEDFQKGVERLRAGIEKGYTVALMCSEAEPFDCHRFSMISRFLEQNGFEVKHILKDRILKTNIHLENQLLKKYHKELPFAPSLEEQIAHAYRLRNKDVAFSPLAPETSEEPILKTHSDDSTLDHRLYQQIFAWHPTRRATLQTSCRNFALVPHRQAFQA